jgi:hypothetical protein
MSAETRTTAATMTTVVLSAAIVPRAARLADARL